jgi:uncharacterized protein YndB with AHSA1/START domain
MSEAATLTITTPTDREVVLTRAFRAPRHLVFDALTKPELLTRWLKAPGRSFDVCEVDLRVGGAYRFVWRGPGRKDVGTRGVYREIVPSERLVHSEAWEDWDAGETVVKTLLAEQNGVTTLTSTTCFASKAVRDAVLKSGLEANAAENYDALAAMLEAQA